MAELKLRLDAIRREVEQSFDEGVSRRGRNLTLMVLLLVVLAALAVMAGPCARALLGG